nr:dead-box atp-dependent rna helicase 36 [Quercus suber]
MAENENFFAGRSPHTHQSSPQASLKGLHHPALENLYLIFKCDVDAGSDAHLYFSLQSFECKENEVISDITKVYKAKRVAMMKMMDDGFDEKAKECKKQKLKTLAEKGSLKKRSKKRKREKSAK